MVDGPNPGKRRDYKVGNLQRETSKVSLKDIRSRGTAIRFFYEGTR